MSAVMDLCHIFRCSDLQYVILVQYSVAYMCRIKYTEELLFQFPNHTCITTSVSMLWLLLFQIDFCSCFLL